MTQINNWEIWNKSGWISLTDPNSLNLIFTELLLSSDFTILGELDYNFQPQGYTKLFLLAESHLAIHTFPENNKTYWELSSCSESKYEKFIQKINNKNVHN